MLLAQQVALKKPVCHISTQQIWISSIDLRFSRRWLWRVPSSGMLRRVALIRTDIPPKCRPYKSHTALHYRRRHSSSSVDIAKSTPIWKSLFSWMSPSRPFGTFSPFSDPQDARTCHMSTCAPTWIVATLIPHLVQSLFHHPPYTFSFQNSKLNKSRTTHLPPSRQFVGKRSCGSDLRAAASLQSDGRGPSPAADCPTSMI
jgi:hypothetical protein